MAATVTTSNAGPGTFRRPPAMTRKARSQA
jgi:hypothetical protein